MAVLALGISFRRAPIDLLERLAFAEDDLVKVYRRVQDVDDVEEAVVLSTCNRVEMYGMVPSYHAGFLTLKRLLAETRGVAEAAIADGLYAHWERDAVEHLFSVAGGLDSMVLGETQIQSQVREALRLAEGEGVAGSRMQALFHAASRAGRRIRQETSLGAAPGAFVERAVALAEEVLGDLSGRSVVVIGAGTMASLGVKHLRGRGVGRSASSTARSRTLARSPSGVRRSRVISPAPRRVAASGARARRRERPAPWSMRNTSVRLGRVVRRHSCCSTWPCPATSSPRSATLPA